jgi:hypothetical protein
MLWPTFYGLSRQLNWKRKRRTKTKQQVSRFHSRLSAAVWNNEKAELKE